MTFLRNLWKDEQGQDLIEYTLLMAFVALASAALFLGAGGSIKGIWTTTNSQLDAAPTRRPANVRKGGGHHRHVAGVARCCPATCAECETPGRRGRPVGDADGTAADMSEFPATGASGVNGEQV